MILSFDPDHDLRRAAHQGRRRPGLDVDQERTGIDDAQRAVDVERLRAGFGDNPLAEHDLEDVPGLDVFLRFLNRGLEGAGRVRAEFALHLPDQGDIGELQVLVPRTGSPRADRRAPLRSS